MAWYDMELSTKPYKALRYHVGAVRGAAFHCSYPLFASASDDGTVHVFHGMVYQVLFSFLKPSRFERFHTNTVIAGCVVTGAAGAPRSLLRVEESGWKRGLVQAQRLPYAACGYLQLRQNEISAPT